MIYMVSLILPYFQMCTLLVTIWVEMASPIRKTIFHAVNLSAKLPLLGIFYLISAANILPQDITFTLLQTHHYGSITAHLQSGLVIFFMTVMALMAMSMILNYYHHKSAERHDEEKPTRSRSWTKCNPPLLFHPQINFKKVAAVSVLLATFACLYGM